MRQIHRPLGYVTVLLGYIQVGYGIDLLMNRANFSMDDRRTATSAYVSWLLLLLLLFYLIGERKMFVSKLRSSQRTVSVSSIASEWSLTWQDVTFRVQNGAQWIVVHDSIYNVASFDHPGGSSVLWSALGTDVSHMFSKNMPKEDHVATPVTPKLSTKYSLRKAKISGAQQYHEHSRLACLLLQSHFVATLQSEKSNQNIERSAMVEKTLTSPKRQSLRQNASLAEPLESSTCLKYYRYVTAILIEKRPVVDLSLATTPVFAFTWQIIVPTENDPTSLELEFEPGDAVQLQCFQMENPQVPWITRTYTPIETRTLQGKLQLVIKCKKEGAMGKCLLDAVPQSTVMRLKRHLPQMSLLTGYVHCERLVMLCNGTGITPFLALIHAHIQMKRDKPVQWIIVQSYACSADIICKDLLETFEQKVQQLTIETCLSEANTRLSSAEILRERLSPHWSVDQQPKILVCGSSSYVESMKQYLHILHYENVSFIE